MEYNEFLKNKIIQHRPVGFEVSVDDLNPMLFDWQKVLVRWSLSQGKSALFESCGLGKTPQQLEWSRQVHKRTGKDVLILAPLAVSAQTVREGRKFNIDVNACRSQSDVRPGVNIANYEILDKFDPSNFVGVVLDECFPPDTPVDVFNIDKSLGCKYIKDISNDDVIYNANGEDYVQETYKRRIYRAVQINYNGRNITCSENHPFFTVHGWKCAQDLQPGDYLMATRAAVRLVRDDISTELCFSKNAKILRSVLLSEMEDVAGGHNRKGAFCRGGSNKGDEEIGMVSGRVTESEERNRTYSESKPDGQPRNKIKGFSYVAEDEAQTFRAWGQWSRDDISAANNEGCTVRELDTGIGYITGETRTWFSNELQSRLRMSRSKNSHRGGWSLSPIEKRKGYKERQDAGFFRVDGVEILEPGHPELEKYRDESGVVYFYDIKAERHPSFSVNGCLVHNSSILKSFMGKTKTRIIDSFKHTPFKLACTATPSPNDHMELLNHADFLDIMPSNEALSRWFINDTMNFGTYRIKGHAANDFWKWVASWAVCLNTPSDIGFDDNGFVLPKLSTVEHVITPPKHDYKNGKLFDDFELNEISATTLYRELRNTTRSRCVKAADIVNKDDEYWICWCNTNNEAELLHRLIPGSVNVHGSMPNDQKESLLIKFIDRDVRVLVTKAKMCGFGLNLQHCHNMAFVGVSFSFEQRYQAIRRCWRFGQKNEVFDHVILSPAEKKVFQKVEEKNRRHNEMQAMMSKNILNYSDVRRSRLALIEDIEPVTYRGKDYELIVGDSVKEIKKVESDSVHFQIFSPPFSNLYIYSDHVADMGNTKDDKEFFKHFSFLVPELYRILVPGRLCVVHCKDLVNYKNSSGRSGIRDFPGDIIRLFESHGFQYHSRVTIWKDPVIEMQRTKAQGLLHKQIKKDSSMSRQGLPDYLIVFRKWPDTGETSGPEPVNRDQGLLDYVGESGPDKPPVEGDDLHSIHVWQRYASPVWFDIRQTNVLNCRVARSDEDEKHICPLQLDVIERCIHLWTLPGDTVYTPFAGIGSELHCAVKMGRRALGHELKAAYAKLADQYLSDLENSHQQLKLFG